MFMKYGSTFWELWNLSYVTSVSEKKCKNFPTLLLDGKEVGRIRILRRYRKSAEGNILMNKYSIIIQSKILDNLSNHDTPVGSDAEEIFFVIKPPIETVLLLAYNNIVFKLFCRSLK